MPFADREVLCISCGATFVFSAGEQAFFELKRFTHEPKRCKECKAKRGNGTGRRRVDTHVVCSACGSNTTVPFKPTKNKPVLCATCFRARSKISDIQVAINILDAAAHVSSDFRR